MVAGIRCTIHNISILLTYFQYIYKGETLLLHWTSTCINLISLCNSTEPLPPPSNTTATTVGHDCTVITLQWDKPDIPSDINSTVSCTPSSTACGASCTSGPCNITGLELNTEYTFTVTLNSGMCGTSMATTTARRLGKILYVVFS